MAAIFDTAFKLSQIHEENGLKIRLIHLTTLIATKKAVGRYKDLSYLEMLSNDLSKL